MLCTRCGNVVFETDYRCDVCGQLISQTIEDLEAQDDLEEPYVPFADDARGFVEYMTCESVFNNDQH